MNSYKLETPKIVDGQHITALTVREMELDDVIELSEIDNTDLRAMRAFLARVTGVDEAIVGRLSMADFQGLLEAATGPLGARPGETLSASAPKSRTSSRRT